MTRKEFADIMVRIGSYYRDRDFLKDSLAIDLWYERLGRFKYGLMARAVDRHAETSRYLPAISDLYQGAMQIFREDQMAKEAKHDAEMADAFIAENRSRAGGGHES